MPTCISPIDCDTSLLTPEIVLRKLLVEDSNGCPAIRCVTTDTVGEYINCDNNQSWKTLVMQLITTDQNGDWALRVYLTA
jgi:hypothetical protein